MLLEVHRLGVEGDLTAVVDRGPHVKAKVVNRAVEVVGDVAVRAEYDGHHNVESGVVELGRECGFTAIVDPWRVYPAQPVRFAGDFAERVLGGSGPWNGGGQGQA